jgi:hypothetical protein
MTEKGDGPSSGTFRPPLQPAALPPAAHRLQVGRRSSREINEILTRHGDIDATDIEVRVQQGEVTLTGTVNDRWAKRLAEDIAEDVVGVTDVQNQLRVRRASESQGSEERTARSSAKRDNA